MKDIKKKLNYVMQETEPSSWAHNDDKEKRLLVLTGIDKMIKSGEDIPMELRYKILDLGVELLEHITGTSHKNAPDKNPAEYREEIDHFNELMEGGKSMTLREEVKKLPDDTRNFCEGALAFAEETTQVLTNLDESNEGAPDAEKIMKSALARKDIDLNDIIKVDDIEEILTSGESYFVAGIKTASEAFIELFDENPSLTVMFCLEPEKHCKMFEKTTEDAVRQVVQGRLI